MTDDVNPPEDTPTDPFAAVLATIESTLPLVRASCARAEQPTGGLSATMLAIKAVFHACGATIEADENAFKEMIESLHTEQAGAG